MEISVIEDSPIVSSLADTDDVYIDGIEPFVLAPAPPTTTDLLNEMFPNRVEHLNVLFRMYKFIFTETKKAIHEKTQDDVLDDIIKSEFVLNLGSALEDSKQELNEHMSSNKLFEKRIKAIPAFIDFAFIYYVRHFDIAAPIYKLPTFLPKYKLITNALRVDVDDLYSCFEQCIEDNFIIELRVENPPYHLRTDMSKKDIEAKINLLVKPLFKDMLDKLLTLDKTKPVDLDKIEESKS
jgi:hypothetical protein